MTKVESLNQMVRAFCVVALLSTFCVVFAWGVLVAHTTIIGADAFAGVLGAAMTWWFKSRDEKAATEVTAATTAATLAAVTGTGPGTVPAPPKGSS